MQTEYQRIVRFNHRVQKCTHKGPFGDMYCVHPRSYRPLQTDRWTDDQYLDTFGPASAHGQRNGQMEWRRPNHMRSHMDALQRMRPVGFRRLPGGLHSVAKQASFCVAFRSHVGRFWRPKWSPKFDFLASFFDVILECLFETFFGSSLEAPNPKN